MSKLNAKSPYTLLRRSRPPGPTSFPKISLVFSHLPVCRISQYPPAYWYAGRFSLGPFSLSTSRNQRGCADNPRNHAHLDQQTASVGRVAHQPVSPVN
eukprot:6907218-Pyramimonas_sp.AAC.1